MKVYTADQIKEADQFTIKNEPIRSIDLMERAAMQLHSWFLANVSKKRLIWIWAGMGNNGGDGLALARLLKHSGYSVRISIVRFSENGSPDFQENFNRLHQVGLAHEDVTSADDLPAISHGTILVDALLGTGLNREVEGWVSQIMEYLNWQEAVRIAVDIPSGLFAEDNDQNSGIRFQANHTLTFQFPKLSFFMPENHTYVGEFHVLPIGISQDFIFQEPTKYFASDADWIRLLLKKRKAFEHKGTYGHACIAAGARGKMGAAVLATKACLRSGAGLTTAHIPGDGLQIMQISAPEAMCLPDDDDSELNYICDHHEFDAMGIGPGIGQSETVTHWLWNTLKLADKPIVLDADALNILSENKEWLALIPEGSILTPHPGEFKRLVGDFSPYHRLQELSAFARRYNCVTLLKGHYTAIASPDGEIIFNQTGNPGMATGGSGDVLTGILTGLLAQGYSPKQVAIIGVYIHGRAGDFAALKIGQESLIAGDIIRNLGKAWKELRA